MTEDERERLRQECYADLDALRGDPLVSERAFRLLEKLVARVTRLETGTFSSDERPTEPERGARTRKSSGAMPAFKARTVIDELEKGRKNDGGEEEGSAG